MGLGGRLDSTNAVENTLVACIMCIGRDHTELLGDTYAAIAGAKCGIPVSYTHLGYLVEKILGSKLARTPRGAEVASVIGISLTTLIYLRFFKNKTQDV